ncbi:MAG: hypothetical protein RR100_20060, partial [Comamonas sp.]
METKEKTTLAESLSAKTHYATASRRSNRLSEIRCLMGRVRVRRCAAARTRGEAAPRNSAALPFCRVRQVFSYTVIV